MRPAEPARAIVVAVAIVSLGGIAASPAADELAGHERRAIRCFGAAARDPEHPCENAALRLSVIPSLSEALIEPSAPCRPLPRVAPPEVCSFGAPPAASVATVALVGNSHAVHWRAPLDIVARKRRWYALTLSRSECPYTAAVPRLRQRVQCMRWQRAVQRWLQDHPSVHTVFISQHATAGVVARHGRDPFEAAVTGYVRAFRALPRSVRRIVVIRDPPFIRYTTFGCIRRALANRQPPGPTCALPRARVLKPDPAMEAVRRMRSRSARGIDMTHFFCDETRCFPVIGGALVKKDKGHLTRTYATTTAPYLRRKINRLTRSR